MIRLIVILIFFASGLFAQSPARKFVISTSPAGSEFVPPASNPFQEFITNATTTGGVNGGLWVLANPYVEDSAKVDRVGSNDITAVNGGLTWIQSVGYLGESGKAMNLNFNPTTDGATLTDFSIGFYVVEAPRTASNSQDIIGARTTETQKIFFRDHVIDSEVDIAVGGDNLLPDYPENPFDATIIAGNSYAIGRNHTDSMTLWVNGVIDSTIYLPDDAFPNHDLYLNALNNAGSLTNAWFGIVGVVYWGDYDIDHAYVHSEFETYFSEIFIPNAPTSLTATATGPDGISVGWNKQNGAAYYDLYQSTNGTDFSLIQSAITGTPVQVSGLTANTQYWYRVKSVSGSGVESEFSNTDNATTDEGETPSTLLAFPGAMGFGKTTTGGRGGTVRFVTNTNNSGAGSARTALTADDGYVIFLTGGKIQLSSAIQMGDNVTVAGQTAPGDGIMFVGWPVRAGQNNIIRGIRSRIGNENRDCISGNCDAFQVQAGNITARHYNVIIDHCSFSWGTDGTLDFVSTVYGSDSMTVSNSIIGETLLPHSLTLLFNGFKNFGIGPIRNSVIRNYLLSSNGRLPLFGNLTTGEVLENTIYNWRHEASSTEEGAAVNFVRNHYKPGPSTTNNNQIRVTTSGLPGGNSLLYLDNNLGGSRATQGAPETNSVNVIGGAGYTLTNPSLAIPTMEDYNDSIAVVDVPDYVLANAGAFPRDAVDARMVNDYINNTGEIVTIQDESIASLTYDAGTAPDDQDSDGIPDQFEIDVLGTDHTSSSGANGANGDHDSDGYTNIEEYINSFYDVTILNASVAGSSTIRVVFDGHANGVRASDISVNGSVTGDFTVTGMSGHSYIREFSLGSSIGSGETVTLTYRENDTAVTNNQTALSSGNDGQTTTTIWSTTDWTGDADIGSLDNSQHQLQWVEVSGSDTIVYGGWIDSDLEPKIFKAVLGGSTTEAFLDTTGDFFIPNDDHLRPSIGVSSDGRIHYTVGMHAYRAGTGGADSSTWEDYPERFHNQQSLYWTSDNFRDISSFTFQGGISDPQGIPWYAPTYQTFLMHPDGTLFAEARIRTYDGGHDDGENGIGMYRYDPEMQTWTALGGVPTVPDQTATEKTLLSFIGSKNNGSPPYFYQGFESDIRIDHTGRIHVAVAGAIGTGLSNANYILYIYSDDKGDTWYNAEGDLLTMPATHTTASVVVNHAVSDFAFVMGLPDGRPWVNYNDVTSGNDPSYKVFTTAGTWGTAQDDWMGGSTKNKYWLGPKGEYIGSRHNRDPGEVWRSKSRSDTPYMISLDDGACCISDQALKTTGDVYLWTTVDGSPGTLKLVRLRFNNGLQRIY